ncbi:PREDICTED: uncharacterized protein LOC106748680 [Dinoponera quadriceps]|uniref:Uncharacterized protein LOC106748680 n=1 Tax=Dinoponera quadriceps TaxID=609295 RepID=A0A6P3XWM7_DINQU|nr:PREDICTED: uncharacterized protein LOC106748680 [Dinoponera quadriceps]
MRKNSLKKNTFSPLAQKIKAPQHLLRLGDEEGELDDESSAGRFQLPSLPRRKSWKDDNNVLSTGNSAATSVSWSQKAENVATQRLEQQWATVERSFYEEDDELSQGPVSDECIQWRTQIPYFRLMGRNLAGANDKVQQLDVRASAKTRKKLDNLQNDEALVEHSLSVKEKEDSTQYKLNKAKFEDVLDLLMEHVISELFTDKEDDDADSLHESLSDTLKITPAPLHGNRRSSSRSTKTNWAEEAVSPNYIENKSLSIRNRLLDTESSLQTIKNDTNYEAVRKRQRNSVSANKPRDFGGDDDALQSKERLCTPHISRNKLGTVFNERIVVSPVPFAVSTRESFSTLKNTPIRFIGENLEISSFRGSARNMLGLRGSARRSFPTRHPDIHSAWQAPVCPAVWPKNVRLAPIDTSRLPSSKNRSQAPSPTVLHCSRKPLSPISRPTIPKSAHAARELDNLLEIQGRHVVPAQSSKIGLLSAGWDYSPRVAKGKKKKARAREGP